MNYLKDKQLREQWPYLYGDVHINVGDGWFNLLYELSTKIEQYCTFNNVPFPVVFQIKEKFGGLRYYVEYVDDIIYKYIQEAESASFSVCEYCGNIGSRKGSGWVKTLCESCAARS